MTLIKLLIFNIVFFICDSSLLDIQRVQYDNIELNIVLNRRGKIRFKQFIFWKDSCSQGYVIIGKLDFIDFITVKNGHKVIINSKHKYYSLESKKITYSVTDYDVETNDLKNNKKIRMYNVRTW